MNSKLKIKTSRCWEVEHFHDKILEKLYVTYPDGFGGYSLISCLNCGQIYSVDVIAELYIKPLPDVLKSIHCIKCNSILSETTHDYPQKYLSKNGKVVKYHGSSFVHPNFMPPINEIPTEESSILKDFYSIYTVFDKDKS